MIEAGWFAFWGPNLGDYMLTYTMVTVSVLTALGLFYTLAYMVASGPPGRP